MFGHPGISALELGAAEPKVVTRKRQSRKGKPGSLKVIHNENTGISMSLAMTAVSEPPKSPLPELTAQQRRRGSFMNHTPRAYEVRPPTAADRLSADGMYGKARNSARHQAGNSKSSSWSEPWHQTPPKAWTVEDLAEVYGNGPRGSVYQEGKRRPRDSADSKMQISNHDSGTSSLSGAFQVGHIMYPPTAGNDEAMSTGGPVEAQPGSKKRRRRQTPYNMSTKSRPSSMQPPVAHHEGRASQTTTSSITEAPSNINLTDIGDVSTFCAIQEYFDSQVEVPLPGSAIRPMTSSSTRSYITRWPEACRLESPFAPTPKLPMNGSGLPKGETPGVGDPRPKRIDSISDNLIRTPSLASVNSDFASAAQGQYSPYDQKYEDPMATAMPKQRKPSQTHVEAATSARPGVTSIGRMAPPILAHDALTASSVLNELSFYLKNTGPPPSREHSQRLRKNSSFKMFKVGGKNRLSCKEASSDSGRNIRSRGPLSLCAQETTTSRGVKHLRIVVPPNDDFISYSHISHISKFKPTGYIPRTSFAFTDEIFNPLGSHDVETAISPLDTTHNEESQAPSSTSSSSRAPKKEPIEAKREPVKPSDHPLATREERARARKLRDLRKSRDRWSRNGSLDAGKATSEGAAWQANMPMTPAQSPIPDSLDASSSTSPPPQSPTMGTEQDHAPTQPPAFQDPLSVQEIALLKRRLVSLQRLNTELAEALAGIIGFEAEDGDMDARAVVRAFRRCRAEGGLGGGTRGEEVRKARVFGM